jgi:hypothetical protein
MKNQFISALALTLCVMSSTVMADTATEIREVILEHIAHMNQELNQDPMRLSKDGSTEFFSSGGLLTYLDRTSGGNTFEMFQGSIKHIEVMVLVEGQAAVRTFIKKP